MPLILPPGEPAIIRLAYPHMMRLDALLWTQWLREDRYDIDQVWYDLKVGTPITIPPDSDANLHAIAIGTGCKRIDVVASVDNQYWIIEVKPYANYVPLGQVRTYVDLFAAKYGRPRPLVPVVVCATADVDLAMTYRDLGVRIERVGTIPW